MRPSRTNQCPRRALCLGPSPALVRTAGSWPSLLVLPHLQSAHFSVSLVWFLLFVSCLRPRGVSLLHDQCSFHTSVTYATDIGAAKLESASLVGGEFNDNRRSLRNFLVDVKV